MVMIHNYARAPPPDPASRKRRNHPCSSPPTDDAAQRSPKKRKLCHPTSPPPQFWDGLSTIPLTPNALQELNRRNTQLGQRNVAHLSPTRRSRRLRARRAVAEEHDCLQPPEQFLKRCSPRCLKRVKKVSTHGGPDLSGLRGYRTSHIANHEMRSSTLSSLGRRKRGSQSPEKSSATPNTTTTRSTVAYDRAFQQHLIDHGTYPDRYKYPDGRVPTRLDNLDEIRLVLRQPRPSLSPSQFPDDRFEEFQLADAEASKESQVIADVIPFIEGDTGDRKCIARQVRCTNFDHLTDGTLVAASPDIYYGARPEQLQRRIRETLSGHVVPSTQGDLPVAPNFFVEVKGPDGSAAVAKRQITYDMALGERGQAALDAYLRSEPSYNNEAHTLGCTYLDGQLKLYATHAIQPCKPGAQPEYVLTQIKAAALTDDADGFRKGATAYRNARDWAKRQRDQAISRANERTNGQSHANIHREDGLGLDFLSEASAAETVGLTSHATITTHGSNASSFCDTESSADELSFDHEPLDKRSKGPGGGLPTRALRLRQESQDGRKRTRSASNKRVDSRSFTDGIE
ncbi:uncharacterized protein F5Z01DRAFT_218526 [Emericellopsis atlantica]|uniref:Uncharacterized protein n=1 Tax=Emericellopsis atlantica TaxID=2614577 RepID=A0A9P7ZJE7_9HYPO|nr:uncharacterized protein F5Z01DRAFT_218526 [Emericellopsis atlantica]KAG9252588.1 hypothetical protein F5Z01DRAFT_218526 [Emericellopsis atlantica]